LARNWYVTDNTGARGPGFDKPPKEKFTEIMYRINGILECWKYGSGDSRLPYLCVKTSMCFLEGSKTCDCFFNTPLLQDSNIPGANTARHSHLSLTWPGGLGFAIYIKGLS